MSKDMMDLVSYLESKDLQVKPGGSGNVYTHCWNCNEDDSKRGRLYIQADPESELFGAYFCHICHAKGGLNAIRKHFGDELIKETSSGTPIIRAAVSYYADKLLENIDAYNYLVEKRGLSHETIKRLRFGWADGGLLTHLIALGFQIEDIKAEGLINHFGEDFLKEKITIPYLVFGEPVTIRGKDIQGKYLSLPGSTARLYGLDSIRGEDTVVIAAGEFDCAVLQQMGYAAVGVPGENIWKPEWTELVNDAKRIYVVFDPDAAGKAGAEKLGTKLGPRARLVDLPEPLPGKKIDISSLYVDQGKTREDFDFLMSKAKGGLLISPAQAYDRWMEFEGNPNLSGLRFNIDAIDSEMKHGLLPGQVVTMLARTNTGKQCPHSSIIPTPIGMRRFGDLEIGDEVFGSNGKSTKVIGIYEQGVTPSYRMHFSDGSSVLSGAEHQWTVYKRYGKKSEWKAFTLTTEELMASKLKKDPRPSTGRGEYVWRIPMIDPVDYPEQNLPIGPYTLGALIANGCLVGGAPVLTTPDYDVVTRIKEEHHEITDRTVDGYCERYYIKNIINEVRLLDLEVKSGKKFIPYQYLIGSIEQRFALLQGLMDGDGSNVSKNVNSTNKTSLAYHTTSPRLAKDVVQLVNSFGGTGYVNSLTRTNPSNGNEYEDIRVSIMLPSEIRNKLFTDRKNMDFTYSNKHIPHRAIVSINYESEEDQRCITVDADDHLYAITENYILTHNTLFSLNILHRMRMAKPNLKILFLSLEQMRNEWFERAHRIHSFYDPGVTTLDTVNYWKSNLFIVDENRISEETLEMCIEQYNFETGSPPDLVLIDYLGYYARSFQGEEYSRTTAAIMGLKAIAKRNQLVFLVPHQANRSNDMGSEVRLDQGRGAGTVEETSDVSLMLWNPDQRKPDQEGLVTKSDQKRELILKMAKSRDGGVNTMCVLQTAPLSLAIVPKGDPVFYERALRERQYWIAGMSHKDAIRAYLTGDESIKLTQDGNVI